MKNKINIFFIIIFLINISTVQIGVSISSYTIEEKTCSNEEGLTNYFNWRDYNGNDYTSPAKNQGSCGSCFAFAALGALECIIEIRENNPDLNPDLSEQYILSCLPYSSFPPGCGCRLGGDSTLVFEYIMSTTDLGNNCNGVILEDCFPYAERDAMGYSKAFPLPDNPNPCPCSNKCDNWEEYVIQISDYGQYFPDGNFESINKIKTYILEKGPITASFQSTIFLQLWGFRNHKSTDYFPYIRDVLPFSNESILNRLFSTNHAVIIIGWKDDQTIKNGGYWICKNSWGTDWGYDGYFNIEYNNLNLDSSNIAWVDYDPDSYTWPFEE
jgi:cathepsin C